MDIRFMKDTDKQNIIDMVNSDIEARTLLNNYSFFDKIESSYFDPVLVAEENGEIIGFLEYGIEQMLKKVDISKGFVKKEHRGKGVYLKLYDEMIRNIKFSKSFIVVRNTRVDNEAVISMCKQQGFIEYSRRPHGFYNPDTDELIDVVSFYKKY